MPIDDHEKKLFDDAPTDIKLGMLYISVEKILDKLDQHPTNCKDNFFAMEKDINRLSKWKVVESTIAVIASFGVSAGVAIGYLKGWFTFLPKE